MKQPSAPHSDTSVSKPLKPAGPPTDHAPWVLREIADTTWRMTVPVVLFVFLGIFADINLRSTPWLTLLGMVVGFYFANVLVRQQIKRSEEN